MKLIGISGTNGSGKDVLSQMLADDFGWLFISASRDLIIPELKRRGLPLERKNMSALTAEWRRADTTGATVNRAIQKFNQKNKTGQYKGLVISSMRHASESNRLHELGGKLVWIDADPKIRYERVVVRSKDAKDRKSFEQFVAEEKAEMTHHGDNATNSMADVKAAADIFLTNNSNNIEKFKQTAQKTLASYL